MNAQQIAEYLQLEPHPEGGFFRETYRSQGKINEESLPIGFSGKRNYSTLIYFLILSGEHSTFHRIKQDEGWHWYKGSPIRLHSISPKGDYRIDIIGNDLEAGQVPQYLVPAGHFFAAEVIEPDSYGLYGCSVAPGFDFEDFEMTRKAVLLQKFPQHTEIIERLARD